MQAVTAIEGVQQQWDGVLPIAADDDVNVRVVAHDPVVLQVAELATDHDQRIVAPSSIQVRVRRNVRLSQMNVVDRNTTGCRSAGALLRSQTSCRSNSSKGREACRRIDSSV